MRTKTGTITSTKMQKTIVVIVRSTKMHAKYRKRFAVSKKFYADNPENKPFAVGETVTIYETRPLSRLKRWTVTPQIKKEKIS